MNKKALIAATLFASAVFGGSLTQIHSSEASQPPGQKGYEGQPGNQGGGGGLGGYEGQPGNQGG